MNFSGNHGKTVTTAKQMIAEAESWSALLLSCKPTQQGQVSTPWYWFSRTFVIKESDSFGWWKALSILYAKASTPYEWHSELFATGY